MSLQVAALSLGAQDLGDVRGLGLSACGARGSHVFDDSDTANGRLERFEDAPRERFRGDWVGRLRLELRLGLWSQASSGRS